MFRSLNQIGLSPFRVLLNKHNQIVTSSNRWTKKYDKQIKLDPLDVTYKYEDSQFLPGPSFANQPYLKPTEDEIVELTRIKLEQEISRDMITKVNPHEAPFNEVLEGVEDAGKYTQVERVE